jgi:hypothetical protein
MTALPPHYHRFNCPFCAGQETIPADLRHCDFCHRNYEPSLIHYISNAYRPDGTMKGICEFCIETN